MVPKAHPHSIKLLFGGFLRKRMPSVILLAARMIGLLQTL